MDDEIDDAGGDPDRDGELGRTAVVLLLVGAALTIAGLTTLVSGQLLIVGMVTFALGAALPLWTSWRRRRHDGTSPGP